MLDPVRIASGAAAARMTGSQKALSHNPLKELRPGLVSIGMPVYNGSRYLGAALDSLLAQEYPDFEIIISDNASDDETEVICRDYAARDARVHYYRADRNMGALWNFVHVFELAGGEYFMWAAHDDLRHPAYLRRCVTALDQNPRAVFCCTGVRLIDELGHEVSDTFGCRSYLPTGATPRERLRALLRSTYWVHVYSLMRTTALARTRIGNPIWGGDVVVVADMCLLGEVVGMPEKLFEYRYFAAKTTEDLAQSLSTADVSVSVSWSDLAADLMESVQRSALSFPERLRLKWTIVFELCLRKTAIGSAMREEGFTAARGALARGKYRRAVTLVSVVLVKQIVAFGQRIADSALYRSSKLKRAIFPSERSPWGRKQG